MEGCSLHICVVFFMFSLCHAASFHDKYKVPKTCTDKWESYIFNDKEYILQNFPLSWENAKIMCRGFHNGSLAILDNAEKAEYLAEVLAESQFSLESAWVGARRASDQDPLGYRWIGGAPLKRTAADVLHGEESYGINAHYPLRPWSKGRRDWLSRRRPSWLNRTRVPVPEDGADCVALDRVYHDKPIFLDLPCKVERAFVCEKDAINRIPTVEIKAVKCRTGRYHVFSASLDWDQAAAYCVSKKMTLANIGTMKCLKKLGLVMLKSRPSIENAWIGARGEQGVWRWLDTGDNILKVPSYIDVDEKKWPPLRDSKSMKQSGCLQLDRHSAHHAVFLESRCGRKMHFICYQDNLMGNAERRVMEPVSQSDDNYVYILIKLKLNWQQAFDNCKKMNGNLASVDNNDVLIQLLMLMGENKEKPVGHIWLSGVLNATQDSDSSRSKYVWLNPSNGKQIIDPRNKTADGFMGPWLDDDFGLETSCLNLDRQYHLSGLLYGLPCDTEQYSICLIGKNDYSTATPIVTIGTVNDVPPASTSGEMKVEPIQETTQQAQKQLIQLLKQD